MISLVNVEKSKRNFTALFQHHGNESEQYQSVISRFSLTTFTSIRYN